MGDDHDVSSVIFFFSFLSFAALSFSLSFVRSFFSSSLLTFPLSLRHSIDETAIDT
tara:strand:+ start:285 stop:452 length:168 start_codon:yes stop_codon:yes gene_type:complete